MIQFVADDSFYNAGYSFVYGRLTYLCLWARNGILNDFYFPIDNSAWKNINIRSRHTFNINFPAVHPAQDIITRLNAGICLLYKSDAADDLLCVDLGGR